MKEIEEKSAYDILRELADDGEGYSTVHFEIDGQMHTFTIIYQGKSEKINQIKP